ncbi:MAG: prolyl oligopeptidase family serine peptidase [Burkholderiaceae bacterium]|nr:prolyl oligopeptidase family serine peptidase [Burkholderiaceae bacterium]
MSHSSVSGLRPNLLSASLCALLLAACGGGSPGIADPAIPPPVVVVPPDPIVQVKGPGEFKTATRLNSITAADISIALRDAGAKAPDVVPKYEVTNYRIEYLTIDAAGKDVLASALVSVPVKPANAVSPVLAYQHGTTMRNAEVPSNHAVAAEAAVVMASSGYIVVAADYVGYGASKGVPHPYLLAAPSAAVVMDLLTATRYWRQSQKILDNKQLFMGGYSEGGYVTMAAHRVLQASTSPLRSQLVSVVTGAGPYSVEVTMDQLLDRVRTAAPKLAPVLQPGLFKLLSDTVRREVRDLLLKELMSDDADVTFTPHFIDNYLADDSAAMNLHSNVHSWKPAVPTRLYHGRDDRTVPYQTAVATLQAMQTQGAGGLVTLTDCPAQPAGHLECVKPFWNFMLAEFATLAKDL